MSRLDTLRLHQPPPALPELDTMLPDPDPEPLPLAFAGGMEPAGRPHVEPTRSPRKSAREALIALRDAAQEYLDTVDTTNRTDLEDEVRIELLAAIFDANYTLGA